MEGKSGRQEALGSNTHLQPDTGRMATWRRKKKRWSRWKLRNKVIQYMSKMYEIMRQSKNVIFIKGGCCKDLN